MRAYRADQVLASEAFEYTITSRREINDLLRKASILHGKGANRNAAEERSYQTLKKQIAEHLISDEETLMEREIMVELDVRTRNRIVELQRKLFGGAGDDKN